MLFPEDATGRRERAASIPEASGTASPARGDGVRDTVTLSSSGRRLGASPDSATAALEVPEAPSTGAGQATDPDSAGQATDFDSAPSPVVESPGDPGAGESRQATGERVVQTAAGLIQLTNPTDQNELDALQATADAVDEGDAGGEDAGEDTTGEALSLATRIEVRRSVGEALDGDAEGGGAPDSSVAPQGEGTVPPAPADGDVADPVVSARDVDAEQVVQTAAGLIQLTNPTDQNELDALQATAEAVDEGEAGGDTGGGEITDEALSLARRIEARNALAEGLRGGTEGEGAGGAPLTQPAADAPPVPSGDANPAPPGDPAPALTGTSVPPLPGEPASALTGGVSPGVDDVAGDTGPPSPSVEGEQVVQTAAGLIQLTNPTDRSELDALQATEEAVSDGEDGASGTDGTTAPLGEGLAQEARRNTARAAAAIYRNVGGDTGEIV